jgi:hypothetical protein
VSASPLPKQAFLPRRELAARDLRAIIERRDSLFALCTAAEQRCLVHLAHWYGSRRHELLLKPNIFSKSFFAEFDHRYFPIANPRPNAVVRGLAKVDKVLTKLEQWRGRRLWAMFIEHLRSLLQEGDDEVLLGVPYFLRKLPLQITFDGQRALEKALDSVIEQLATDQRYPAAKRFHAVDRCIRRLSSTAGLSGEEVHADLHIHAWQLLLEVATQDMGSAVRLVDEHWKQTHAREVLMSLHLHEIPELAWRLAVKFRPHRSEFAADMLRNSIFYASFRLAKLDHAAGEALERVIAASCRLLADWTIGVAQQGAASALLSMDRLLQFGEPDDGYWGQLPRECLAIIKRLPPAEQEKQLRLLAQVVFYADGIPSIADEALDLLEVCLVRKLSRKQPSSWEVELLISNMCSALSVVEDKTLSFRNKRIPANPAHRLVHIFDKYVHVLLDDLMSSEPSAALRHLVSVAVTLSNQTLRQR